jgi:hypothetical protein
MSADAILGGSKHEKEHEKREQNLKEKEVIRVGKIKRNGSSRRGGINPKKGLCTEYFVDFFCFFNQDLQPNGENPEHCKK